ncbi:MAG: pilus assembly protein [Lachnoclostridium sp.]|jgi:hypothetical protein|nr:pilus assembly protein [Lachnoclostridium sp.]
MKYSKGSFTVEAAFILPIFFFAMMSCVFIIQLLICQDEVQWALTRIARESSAEMALTENKILKNPAYFTGKMALYMKGSGVFVSMADSLVQDDKIELTASYSVRLPFQIFAIKEVRFYQVVHTRVFAGVISRRMTSERDRIVYVAETGQVYHFDRECTYLRLSISQVRGSDIENLRNEGGAKYKPCESCADKGVLHNRDLVYITNYGNRYHTARTCSRMKRTIHEHKLSEIGKLPPCSKCSANQLGER